MRKLFCMVSVVVMTAIFTFGVNAQENPILGGAGVAYATELDGVGIFLGGVYQITPQWEGAASYTFFFKKDNVNWSTLDLNAHYVFFRTDNAAVYGLAGLNFLFWKVKYADFDFYDDDYWDFGGVSQNKSATASQATLSSKSFTGSETGLNLGVGGRVGLTDKLWLNPEIKYVIGDGDFLGIRVGLLYNF